MSCREVEAIELRPISIKTYDDVNTKCFYQWIKDVLSECSLRCNFNYVIQMIFASFI